MPKLAEKYDNRDYYHKNYSELRELTKRPRAVNSKVQSIQRTQDVSHPNVRAAEPARKRNKLNNKKAERNNFIHRIISGAFILTLAVLTVPTTYNRVVKSFFFKSPYPEIKTDYEQLLTPTLNYLHNDLFLGKYSLQGAETKKPQMITPVQNQRLTGLENQLHNLSTLYPMVEPSVYVWDYETGNYASINSDKPYSAASIIKVPVLIQLFRSIERNQLTIYDEMKLTEYYRSEGSGSMQFKAHNSVWSIDSLARLMITESDNTATNMLMAKLGSMTDINSAVREWGLSRTHVKTWLPDLEGTNHTTAEDMARMLYNIDENPKFLSFSSREKIFDYMGHVHNDRLIPAGLGAGATFLHKTGDIGKMLGDAGIVFAPNGKKYIVVILANRPYNSPAGKDYIVKASEIIYNTMVK